MKMHRIVLSLCLLTAPVAAAGAASPSEFAWPALVDDRADDRADDLYDEGREAIEEGRYDRAVDRFTRLIDMKSNRTDAALYWKAYCQYKLGQRDEALNTVADLQKRFADSRWSRDAKALEMEVRQASGQPVSPAAQDDDELKLLALRGLMQSDPNRALPMIEQLLAGNSSVRVKENALFVLSQSRLPRAREIIVNTARMATNPDVKIRAVRYIGAMDASADNRRLLDEIYRSSDDPALKRAVIQAYGSSRNAAALVELARMEKDPAMKRRIVSRLAGMKSSKEATDYFLEILK